MRYIGSSIRLFSLLSISRNCSYYPVNQDLETDAVSRTLNDQTKSLGRVLRFDDILFEIYGASAHYRRPKCSSFLRSRSAS